jgi:hypothetical protein
MKYFKSREIERENEGRSEKLELLPRSASGDYDCVGWSGHEELHWRRSFPGADLE